MEIERKSWKRTRWLLIAGVGLQFYFVQELVVAFAFFAIGFVAIAFVILSLYMLQKGWEAAVARFTHNGNLSGPSLQAGSPVRDAMTACEEMLSQELKIENRNSKERDSKMGINWKRETSMLGTDLGMRRRELSSCFRKRAV